MHINNIPVESFVKSLEYIPLKNAINIMLVNKEWHRTSRNNPIRPIFKLPKGGRKLVECLPIIIKKSANLV